MAILGLSKSRTRMHDALIQTLIYIHDTGNRNNLHNLVDGLKKDKANASHLHRITVWLEDMGGFIFDKDDKSPTYKSVIGWNGKQVIEANLSKAKASPWFEYKKPAVAKVAKIADFQGFNLDGELTKVINAAKSMHEKEQAMTEDMRSKVHLDVKNETMKALLGLLDMLGLEAILREPTIEEQIAYYMPDEQVANG